ncbi:SEC-C metal-binding domain-containing protein [Ferroacidibacillus organovorans]|nr:SEC-C domain-containing protein [Ferroacidibacillus organovorans]
MAIPKDVKAALQRLGAHTFRIAVHPGLVNAYQGQPLAIAFEPAINYGVFPDHPHLNTGGVGAILGQGFYVPDTICYEENILGLGSDPVERFLQAFGRISVWLLRHMIWMETKKLCDGKGQWIGPEAPPLTPKQRAESGFWNPSDLCRCNSGKRYSDCHMLSDLGYGILTKSISTKNLKQGIAARYEQRREQHKKFYSQIRRSS